jgi:uncharacterized membrane protein
MSDPVVFQRARLGPIDCISEGWARIRDQYGLLLGISVVGVLAASVVPFGILMGPMFCGIYAAFRDKWQGRVVRFESLSQGFESFLFQQSLIATLIVMGTAFVLVLPVVVVGIAAGVAGAVLARESSGVQGLLTVSVVGGLALLWLVLASVIGALFLFAFPLILDRRLPALEAVKLSARAAWANFGGVMLLMIANLAASLVGMMCCYVGALLWIPIHFASSVVAYERVFGFSEPPARVS